MSISTRSISLWSVLSAVLTVGTLLSAILATLTLDTFLEGPGPASVTTRVPGLVYATATVMKVCIPAGLVMALIALERRLSAGRARRQAAPDPPMWRVPVWGIVSLTLAPLTPIVGAVVLVTTQVLAHMPDGLSMMDLSRFSRASVLVQLLMIAAGAMAAVTSLLRHEPPRLLPTLGLVTNILLIALIWQFEFYAVGFDQDTWAP